MYILKKNDRKIVKLKRPLGVSLDNNNNINNIDS